MTYTIVVTPLSDEDGGGFLGLVPDLHGCMSDGETRAEAIKNTEDAIEEWISLHKSIGREIPRPGCATKAAAEKQKHLLDALQALLAYADDVDGRLDEVALRIAGDVIIERGVTAAHRFEPVVEIEHHLIER